jgi:hypothetical protein
MCYGLTEVGGTGRPSQSCHRVRVVSARTANRRPQARPDRKAKPTRRDQALAEFHAWKNKYFDLDVLARLTRQISEIELALSTAEQ